MLLQELIHLPQFCDNGIIQMSFGWYLEGKLIIILSLHYILATVVNNVPGIPLSRWRHLVYRIYHIYMVLLTGLGAHCICSHKIFVNWFGMCCFDFGFNECFIILNVVGSERLTVDKYRSGGHLGNHIVLRLYRPHWLRALHSWRLVDHIRSLQISCTDAHL